MVTVVDGRVEIPESIDVEKALASVEGSGMVIVVFSDTPIEVTAETLTGNEMVWVIGRRVAEEWVAVSCGGKIPAGEDLAVLSVEIVAKLVPNILVVEAPRGSGKVCVSQEV